jgi:Putative prokaryotic signal transducing protein
MADELKIVATVNNDVEAAVVCGRLSEAGIRSMQRLSGRGGPWNPAGARDVCVAEEDFDRANEVLKADEGVSVEELTREEELTESSNRPTQPG